ncbi:MAG TPA: hypothetical protein ENF94_02065 [Candidatus Woesearchaeota archaeon]|nr:MAG: hypothetical protein DRJ25_01280 [Candidatus Woesearchaeota archaeon]HDD70928.1 hypothetical protein [Candidatus Woesearchaeota archaeon]
MNLKDWLLNFLKSRSSFFGSDSSVEEKEDFIILKKESGVEFFFVKGLLDDSVRDRIAGCKDKLTVVVLNKKANVDWLVNNWDFLIRFPRLCFMFVNPDVSEKWAIFPKTHDLISERNSLRKGLLSLFESVPPA